MVYVSDRKCQYSLENAPPQILMPTLICLVGHFFGCVEGDFCFPSSSTFVLRLGFGINTWAYLDSSDFGDWNMCFYLLAPSLSYSLAPYH